MATPLKSNIENQLAIFEAGVNLFQTIILGGNPFFLTPRPNFFNLRLFF